MNGPETIAHQDAALVASAWARFIADACRLAATRYPNDEAAIDRFLGSLAGAIRLGVAFSDVKSGYRLFQERVRSGEGDWQAISRRHVWELGAQCLAEASSIDNFAQGRLSQVEDRLRAELGRSGWSHAQA